ncbi:uncharacterized protein LOC113284568 isoform X2 [Papaver somniferum]|uniref:uncharacterized protein LOC113284568 isoform X2 n=1 Tax=Papaver somniferum TaxID=3469 RepID=UPI000E6FC26C|nr:uncharacterized protein LOC113284568 isoform X2 [Papaver somniferum]
MSLNPLIKDVKALTFGLIRYMVQQRMDPNQWHAAICIDTMEVIKPMDVFWMLKILTCILIEAMTVLDNQQHQQQCCRGKKPSLVCCTAAVLTYDGLR